jgi:hypothetical protein
MPVFRELHLIIAIVLLSLVMLAQGELRSAGYLSFEASRVIAYIGVGLNAIMAVLGMRIAHRMAWIAYLIVSVAGVVLIGAVTPINALVLLSHFL